jgi:hypothetical protein
MLFDEKNRYMSSDADDAGSSDTLDGAALDALVQVSMRMPGCVAIGYQVSETRPLLAERVPPSMTDVCAKSTGAGGGEQMRRRARRQF